MCLKQGLLLEYTNQEKISCLNGTDLLAMRNEESWEEYVQDDRLIIMLISDIESYCFATGNDNSGKLMKFIIFELNIKSLG